MEPCTVKPQVKKNTPLPRTPPKPVTTPEINGNVSPEMHGRATPGVPARPADTELSRTQNHIRRRMVMEVNEANGNVTQPEAKGRPAVTPRVPPRPTDQVSSVDSDAEDAEEKASEPSHDKGNIFSGMFRKSPKTTEAAQMEEEKGGLFSGILRKSPRPPGEGTPAQDKRSLHGEPSAGKDSLPEDNNTKEKGNVFSGMFKKAPKPAEAAQTEEDKRSLHSELSGSRDSLTENHKQEKGGLFSGLRKKMAKAHGEVQENLSGQKELSASRDNLSETTTTKDKRSLHGELSAIKDSWSEDNSTKEKAAVFGVVLRKTPKAQEEENLSAQKELSASNNSLSDVTTSTKEKGNVFSGMFKKAPKPAEAAQTEEDNRSLHDELSTSSDSLSEKSNKEKDIFSGLFKKAPKPADVSQTEEDKRSLHSELSASSDSLSEKNKDGLSGQKALSASNDSLSENNAPKEKGNVFSGMFKKAPKPAEGPQTEEDSLSGQKELSSSNDDLAGNPAPKEKNIFSGMFKKAHKPSDGLKVDEELDVDVDKKLSASSDNLSMSKEKAGGFAGLFKRSSSIDDMLDNEEKGGLFAGLHKKTPKAPGDSEQKELSASSDSLPTKESNLATDRKLSNSSDNLLDAATQKEKTGGLSGMFKRSPKPAPRAAAAKDPLSDTKGLSASCDSLTENKDDLSTNREMSASNDSLSDAPPTTKERKGGLGRIFRRPPKAEQQDAEDMELAGGGSQLKRRRTIKRKTRVVSFRVKRTLPKLPKLNPAGQSEGKLPVLDETMEMQDLIPIQESTEETEAVEMAAYPTEGNPLESEEENDGLLDWWKSVEGWAEWNEASNFQEEDEEMAVELVADRVFMAARLFVRLFNRHGASLQQRILEILAQADAADYFHKKTVTAAVGGGVASVVGSIATITGLILAPFTFGASIIVTAVGISVATAGSLTSATANITDTVHSNMDVKKVEKMIQGYQEEMTDIRECLEFVQEGMDTLQMWDFEKYTESAAKKALNHNIKHVMKEGGRAGKALMINTDKLISTVQVLGVAGGAAKAAQAISITTGVMSALFLALDVFFLAKDSRELHKGAKTKFATKIREVCKDLQDGLLELNKVKSQLQMTMDGIELEEFEEFKEVEVEVDEELESDPVKLAQLEQELDLLEENLDKKKVLEEQKKGFGSGEAA